VIARGELWWADLGLPRGSAPALRRPVLVVSADPYNRSSLGTVTVVVLTTTTQLAALPGNVLVPADVSGLPQDSVVNVTQVATIDRSVLEERVAALPDWLLVQVDAGLQRALGLARA
jgi:mRNA interferase MazF